MSEVDSDYYEDNMMEVLEEAENDDIPSRIILSSVELLNNLKVSFHDESCSRIQQIQILTMLPKS